MVTIELGGNIVLENFEIDQQEMIVVKKIVGNYAEKIRYFKEYQELKLEMKTHLKAKNRHFEVKALLTFDGGTAPAESQGLNLFVLINEVLEKILQEVKHKVRKE